MEGLTFYWIAWFFWVIATFMLKKKHINRLRQSIWILLLIIFSPYSFFLFDMEISLASLILVIPLFIVIVRMKKLIAAHLLFCSFIIMLSYVCFHLFELYDPVWIIVPRIWMLTVLLISLSIVLQTNKLYRIFIILFGSIQGEFLYALILKKYTFPHVIGSFAFLDVIALSTIIIAAWNGLEYLSTFYEKHLNQIEKEKQKLS
ncbi:YphA family membrane protein [Cytobacillus dafuensis]|uniref:Uncharacterized protein n=1 Tax=Cytobacillus dafuensis TaxID=1742359 RepID=A0A5B8Z5W6_CYTDA|nr:hypothetical protein [Cytobacillus dafuensis]QED48445.1 hypothetical protein FSZ17_15015 [Cytobacillus dafuensis]